MAAKKNAKKKAAKKGPKKARSPKQKAAAKRLGQLSKKRAADRKKLGARAASKRTANKTPKKRAAAKKTVKSAKRGVAKRPASKRAAKTTPKKKQTVEMYKSDFNELAKKAGFKVPVLAYRGRGAKATVVVALDDYHRLAKAAKARKTAKKPSKKPAKKPAKKTHRAHGERAAGHSHASHHEPAIAGVTKCCVCRETIHKDPITVNKARGGSKHYHVHHAPTKVS